MSVNAKWIGKKAILATFGCKCLNALLRGVNI